MTSAWDIFWFKAIDVRQYAILRITFGCLTAVYLIQLLPFATLQFSRVSWITTLSKPNLPNWGSWSLFNFDSGAVAIVYCYGIFILGILAALAMMVGWQTRSSSLITWVVLVSLWNRNPLILDGDDLVLKVMAFYLCLSPSGQAWSIDARHAPKLQLAPIWPLRLIQFQIALIYFVSGWVKFHSTEWLNGTVLQYVLIHPQYARFDCSSLMSHPIFLQVLAFLTGLVRWWELLFPFLLFNRYLRLVAIGMGMAFHLGLLILMTLRWFPMLMLALYPALIPNQLFINLVNVFAQRRAKRRIIGF